MNPDMEQIISIFNQVDNLLYPWLNEIATAIISCFIVAFDADINHCLRRKLLDSSFILHTFTFVLVNAFGYIMLIVTFSPILARSINKLPASWLLCTVILIFLLIGNW